MFFSLASFLVDEITVLATHKISRWHLGAQPNMYFPLLQVERYGTPKLFGVFGNLSISINLSFSHIFLGCENFFVRLGLGSRFRLCRLGVGFG